MRPWKIALQEHRNAILNAGFKEENILGIFAYGSQNYGVATDNSDWDTKAVIVPSFEELVLQPPVSRELQLGNGEHCEVKDIREMVNNYKKQNINFIETLYTEYKWINPLYAPYWKTFFENNKEEIAHYDRYKTVQSICGQAKHILKQNLTDGKKVGNGYRLLHFLEKYIAGADYIDCIFLSDEERRKIINFKEMKTPIDEDYTQDLIEKFDKLRVLYQYESDKRTKDSLDSIMKMGILKIIDLSI